MFRKTINKKPNIITTYGRKWSNALFSMSPKIWMGVSFAIPFLLIAAIAAFIVPMLSELSKGSSGKQAVRAAIKKNFGEEGAKLWDEQSGKIIAEAKKIKRKK